MQSEFSNTSNEKVFSQSLKTEKEKMICQDGFCTIPEKNKGTKIKKDDLNLFDPV